MLIEGVGDMGAFDVATFVWGVISGLVALSLILAAVYWKIVMLIKELTSVLGQLLESIQKLTKENHDEHQRFLDMVTRIDERSKK